MPSKTNVVLGTSDTSAGELRFPPAGSVTVTVTNGTAMVQLASVPSSGVVGWQSAQYDAQERALIPGVWVFDPSDFGGNSPCAIQARSLNSTQPATVSISA